MSSRPMIPLGDASRSSASSSGSRAGSGLESACSSAALAADCFRLMSDSFQPYHERQPTAATSRTYSIARTWRDITSLRTLRGVGLCEVAGSRASGKAASVRRVRLDANAAGAGTPIGPHRLIADRVAVPDVAHDLLKRLMDAGDVLRLERLPSTGLGDPGQAPGIAVGVERGRPSDRIDDRLGRLDLRHDL